MLGCRQRFLPLVATALILTGCRDTPVPIIEDAPPAPHITNAQLVQDVLERKKGSVIMFQANPDGSTRCKYMFVEISKQLEENAWTKLKSSTPGKDRRESMGENDIQNQLHFFSVKDPGNYAITALGCEEYALGMIKLRGMIANFTVKDGQLNYIGEITLQQLPGGVLTTKVSDRSDFAQEKLKTNAPKLLPYFTNSPMLNLNVSITDTTGTQLKAQANSINKENELNERLNQIRDEILVIDEAFNNMPRADKIDASRRRGALMRETRDIANSINTLRFNRLFGQNTSE